MKFLFSFHKPFDGLLSQSMSIYLLYFFFWNYVHGNNFLFMCLLCMHNFIFTFSCFLCTQDCFVNQVIICLVIQPYLISCRHKIALFVKQLVTVQKIVQRNTRVTLKMPKYVWNVEIMGMTCFHAGTFIHLMTSRSGFTSGVFSYLVCHC